MASGTVRVGQDGRAWHPTQGPNGIDDLRYPLARVLAFVGVEVPLRYPVPCVLYGVLRTRSTCT
jgi:hypothetical protein